MVTLGLKGIPGLEQLDAAGVSNLRAGVALIGGSSLVAWLLHAVSAQIGDISSNYLQSSVAGFVMMFGVFPGLGWFIIYWLVRSVESDTRKFIGDDSRLMEFSPLFIFDRRTLVASCGFGILVVGTLAPLLVAHAADRTWGEEIMGLHSNLGGLLKFYVIFPLLGIPGGLTLGVYRIQHRYLTVLAQSTSIDLLDLSRCAHISQPAVRFLVVAGVSLSFLFLIPVAAPEAESVVSTMTLFILAMAAVIIGLYVHPVYLLRDRILDEKNLELGLVRLALNGEPGVVSKSLLARSGGSLTPGDWLSYQMFIESRWDWPIGPQIQKIVLFGLLPPITWALAATIENVLY